MERGFVKTHHIGELTIRTYRAPARLFNIHFYMGTEWDQGFTCLTLIAFHQAIQFFFPFTHKRSNISWRLLK